MAKTAKSHHGSAKSRKPKAVVGKSAKKAAVVAKAEKQTKRKVTAPAKAASPKAVAKPAAEVTAKAALVPDKKKTDKVATFGNGMFGRPAMRRGRRPKALAEYQPSNQEEEEYNPDLDYRGLEYDTGIRVNKAKDDGPFSLDRFDDYDEELNFDY